jgi:aminoglycoside 2'-N-acetyltransferase I
VEVVHTAFARPEALEAARLLLYDVFDDMTEADWEHCLGGLHALAWEQGELVGHAALAQRRLLHAGRALRAGYVEGVAVRSDHRRGGIGGTLMAALEDAIRAAYDLGALGASDDAIPFYLSRGWVPWRGPLGVVTPDGCRPTPDEAGGVLVLPAAADLDLDAELLCNARPGDPW